MSFEHGAWILGSLLVAVVILALQIIYLVVVMKWADERTTQLSYYGLPARGRQRFKRLLRMHALLLSPILGLLARTTRFRFSRGTFHYNGVAAPRAGACTVESFERAVQYEPRRDDVFVVTQMRCGTTWMQHLVFQALTRGNRDLAREELPLNALSPWLESHKTVTVDDAPRVGNGPRARIIKTHLPASLCPFSTRAKYICVIRHPVSCFASCVDFVRSNLRGFQPEMDEFLRWYMSNESMWWNTWVEHVDGWWARAEGERNVLFVRFEDMNRDLESVTQKVAEFLELPPLNDHEMSNVCRKCNFEYMRQNAEVFEMHSPHLLQVPGSFFVSGKVDRYSDISLEVRQLIVDWCSRELREKSFPIHRFYPEQAAFSESQALCNQAITDS